MIFKSVKVPAVEEGGSDGETVAESKFKNREDIRRQECCYLETNLNCFRRHTGTEFHGKKKDLQMPVYLHTASGEPSWIISQCPPPPCPTPLHERLAVWNKSCLKAPTNKNTLTRGVIGCLS